MNALYAHGLTILYDRCKSEEFGIGNINDAIIKHIKQDHGRVLKLSEVRDYLMKLTAGEYLPPLKTPTKVLEDADLRAIFEDQIATDWTPIQTMIGSLLNIEGAGVGTGIKRLFLSGGGAAVYQKKFQSYLPSTEIIITNNAQDQNAMYYHDLTRTIERGKPDAWKR